MPYLCSKTNRNLIYIFCQENGSEVILLTSFQANENTEGEKQPPVDKQSMGYFI